MYLNQNNKPIKFSYRFSSKFFLLIFPTLMMIGCATSHRGKVFEYSLIGGLVGAAYGNSRAEFKQENALMYGSQGALAGAAIATILDDSDKKIKELEAKVKFFDESSKANPQSSLTEIPEEFRPLLESKNYEIYQINRWTRKGPRYLVKESEVIELK